MKLKGKQTSVGFISGDANTDTIASLLRGKTPLKLTVAFWGEHAIELLQGNKQDIQVICNLESGASNPNVIRQLRHHKNIQFRSCQNLHAKVYWSPSKVIITSANCSANGLSYEDNELFGWLEAGVVVLDNVIIKETEKWFDKLWADLNDITPADLKIADERWKQKRANRLPKIRKSKQQQSLLDAFRKNPAVFKDKKIYFTIWSDDASPEDHDAVKEAFSNGKNGMYLKDIDYFVDWDKIPEDSYLVGFKYSKRRMSNFILSRSFQKHIYIKGSEKNSRITVTRLISNIEDTYIFTPDDKKFLKSVAADLWALAKGDEEGRVIDFYSAKEILLKGPDIA